MKITMVGNFGLWYKGTMGARALPMARALVAAGHEVCMVVPPWDDPRSSGAEDRIDGVRIANVKLPPHIPLLWHALLTLSLLVRVLREPADVIHVFKPKAYAGLVQIAAVWLRRLRLLRARIVLDTDDWEGKGGWNEMENFPRPVKWLTAWHESWCLRHADAITLASRELERLTLALGVSPDRIFYVPNGVCDLNSRARTASSGRSMLQGGDGEDPDRSPSPLEECSIRLDGSPTILLYTRFFEFQAARVLRIFTGVRRDVPEAKLLVVGRGLRGEEGVLGRLARDSGLGQDVFYAGWVEPPEIPRWFDLADLAIYPMDDTLLNRAKCPMKLVDLMSRGMPVVADRVGQVAEYVKDGESGILVDSGAEETFAGAVARLLLDERMRRDLGERARERVLGDFDWRCLIANVQKAYGRQ